MDVGWCLVPQAWPTPQKRCGRKAPEESPQNARSRPGDRSRTNPPSQHPTWQYDALSRVTTLTLANGAYTTYAYDAAGRVTRVANVKSGGTIISSFDYSYDAVGNPTSLVEASGDRVTWSYDAKYQLTRERRSGTNAYDITYTYDAVGSRLTKLTGGVTTTYTYDAANQLSVENAGGTLATYSYDANQLTVENAGGSVTTYTWDGENRMATATLPGEGLRTRAGGGVKDFCRLSVNHRLPRHVVAKALTRKWVAQAVIPNPPSGVRNLAVTPRFLVACCAGSSE